MDSLFHTNLLGCFWVSQLAQGDLIKVRQSYAEVGNLRVNPLTEASPEPLKKRGILNLETIMFGRFHVVIWEGVLALAIA